MLEQTCCIESLLFILTAEIVLTVIFERDSTYATEYRTSHEMIRIRSKAVNNILIH